MVSEAAAAGRVVAVVVVRGSSNVSLFMTRFREPVYRVKRRLMMTMGVVRVVAGLSL